MSEGQNSLPVGDQEVRAESPSDGPSPPREPPFRPPSPRANFGDSQHPPLEHDEPIITNAIRTRILKALATIKRRRGSPFSFVTSGDSPSFSNKGESNAETPDGASSPGFSGRSQEASFSLKLSCILRPLRNDAHSGNNDDDWRPMGCVKMPSYLSSMTMGQTITDPIDGGILSLRASHALFEFFMVQMNAKWEYILDPHTDTHNNMRKRSTLLFAAILFCSSKFAKFTRDAVISSSDPFLQSRLCILARNLVIKTLAEGDRSIETMQALYLLVCWKDADDEISYLHSGYAFRILHDLDLGHGVSDGREMAQRKRTWLALFRQDRQQSLFFMRRGSLGQGDDNMHLLGNLDNWLESPYSLALDFAGCCSAGIRCIQSKLRHMVQKASVSMLPCLLDLMDTELESWRVKWNGLLEGEGRARAEHDSFVLPGALYADREHLATLVGVWENSVRLNLSSAIFRQALIGSVSSSLHPIDQGVQAPVDIDLSTMKEVLSPGLPGLTSSVESAFETLRYLMRFPISDIRRAPDAILLLAPNAALFLCLLLCLPGSGILGPGFQKTAVSLIRDIAQHMRLSVQTPQDIVALLATYLESIVDLLGPSGSEENSSMSQSAFDMNSLSGERDSIDFDFSTLQATQIPTDGLIAHGFGADQNDSMVGITQESSQNLHVQSLANLLDGYFFWDIPTVSSAPNIS
ncbi:hypothetical protein N7509_013016 [Penicillium cosmopolitanum]|uniref:Transcription factor domain-containing protein n=1 Tax=Penicillium cosmopolitanum TaxID=1131564 RepID=A0A9W9SD05_9EURO|nr:uncharacterized protein N7509_013016 [Penicillium cosmopolitanum]KAJ5376130.1 hypothetical protein N7509_013016 [Penicillium cosmopolitanum]